MPLFTVQGSSDLWVNSGSQAEQALNTGWLPDQTINSTGGFVTSAGPSTAVAFLSTGDTTAFYLLGRPCRVVHAGGTAIGVVAAASYSTATTQTTVTLTAMGSLSGTTSISTASITSASVAAVYSNSSGNNPISLNIAPSTATVNFLQVGTAATAANPTITSTGTDTNIGIRMAYKGTGGVIIPSLSPAGPSANADPVQIVTGTTVQLSIGANTSGSFLQSWASLPLYLCPIGNPVNLTGADYVSMGSSAATAGVLRFGFSTTLIVGRTSSNVDDRIWPMQTSSTNITTDIIFTTGTAGTFTDGPDLALGRGTWFLSGTVTMYSTTVGAGTITAKLWDTVTTLRTGNFSNANAATTSNGYSIDLSGIASSSSVWRISVASSVGATTGNHLTGTDPVTGSTNASGLVAVKIG